MGTVEMKISDCAMLRFQASRSRNRCWGQQRAQMRAPVAGLYERFRPTYRARIHMRADMLTHATPHWTCEWAAGVRPAAVTPAPPLSTSGTLVTPLPISTSSSATMLALSLELIKVTSRPCLLNLIL